MFVTGRPAAYARTLAAAARRKAVVSGAALAGCVAAAVGAVVLMAAGHTVALVVVLAGLVGAAASYGRAIEANAAAARAVAGVRSEDRVADVLERLHPAAVGFGLMLGAGGDVDVVVAGPCLAAVEVKTGRGRVRADAGALTVNGRRMPGDAVSQARRQAAGVRRHCGRYTEAVVCVVDMDGAPQRHGDVTVCSLNDLPSVLNGLPRVLEPGAAVALMTALARRSEQHQP